MTSLLIHFSISTHFSGNKVSLWYEIVSVKIVSPFFSTVGFFFESVALWETISCLYVLHPFLRSLHKQNPQMKHPQKPNSSLGHFSKFAYPKPGDVYRIKVFKGVSSFCLFRQSYQAPGVGDCLRQQLGSRLAWTLTASQPSLQSATSKGFSNAVSRGVPRSRREGDTSGEQRCFC